jgi:hypothetical protein
VLLIGMVRVVVDNKQDLWLGHMKWIFLDCGFCSAVIAELMQVLGCSLWIL